MSTIRRDWAGIALSTGIATLLWFYMFSPWTQGRPDFWLVMSLSACTLTLLALHFSKGATNGAAKDNAKEVAKGVAKGDSATGIASGIAKGRAAFFSVEKPLMQVCAGILLAFALWGIFWIGDKVSAWMFSFARPQVDLVYGMKSGANPALIGVLLLLLIGPAEEFFWRGYVQRTLTSLLGGKHPEDKAFFITTAVYALIHIWSFNFMLVMAALVAGIVWGGIYRLCPKALPALIISHALWDCLVFVVLPI